MSLQRIRTTSDTTIPYDHRVAMETIDSALECEVCAKTAKLSAEPRPFARACFYFLDAMGDASIDAVKFCKYLKENGCIGQSRFILSEMLRCNPTKVSRIYR